MTLPLVDPRTSYLTRLSCDAFAPYPAIGAVPEGQPRLDDLPWLLSGRFRDGAREESIWRLLVALVTNGQGWLGIDLISFKADLAAEMIRIQADTARDRPQSGVTYLRHSLLTQSLTAYRALHLAIEQLIHDGLLSRHWHNDGRGIHHWVFFSEELTLILDGFRH